MAFLQANTIYDVEIAPFGSSDFKNIGSLQFKVQAGRTFGQLFTQYPRLVTYNERTSIRMVDRADSSKRLLQTVQPHQECEVLNVIMNSKNVMVSFSYLQKSGEGCKPEVVLSYPQDSIVRQIELQDWVEGKFEKQKEQTFFQKYFWYIVIGAILFFAVGGK